MSNLTKNLLTIINVLVILLVIAVSSTCAQTVKKFHREVELLEVKKGVVEIKAFRYSLITIDANGKQTEMVTRKKGKVFTNRRGLDKGEWIVIHEYGDYRGSEPVIKEID